MRDRLRCKERAVPRSHKTDFDAAVAAGAKTLDEVKALKLDDRTVEELPSTDEIGKTAKRWNSAYECIAAPA